MKTRYYLSVLCFFALFFAGYSRMYAQCGATSVTPTPPLSLICEGNDTTITFSSTGTCGGTYEYQVMDGATVVQAWSSSTSFVAAPTDSTNYTVLSRCSACPATVVNSTFAVSVTKQPSVSGAMTLCSGNNTVLTATGSNGNVTWWDSQTGGTQLSADSVLTTPALNATTTYWAQVVSTTVTSTGGSVLITECGTDGANGGTGSEDYIEISNLYSTPVNTTGWVVAISDSYTNINIVNSIYWHLPSSFSPCSMEAKTDVAGTPNYWGNNIFWNPGNSSWAIIIDNFGNVVDFIAWGWTAAQLASFNPTINGFSITLGSEWIGNGCPAGCSSVGTTQYSFARNGNSDNNDMNDFFCQPTSVNLLNPGLTCGWSASASCPYPYTVVVNPTPVITDIPDQTVCGSYVLPAITGTNLTGNEAYYTGSGGTGTQYNTGDSITSTVTLYLYDATGTLPNCTDEESFLITVTPNNLAVNAGPDQTVCAGTQVTLTASGATTYTWDNGVSNGVAFTPAVGTVNYTVIGTTLGCTASDQVTVTVNSNPVISAGIDTTLCQGTNYTLTGTGAGTGGNYVWNNGVTNAVMFTPPVGTTNYTVNGTDVNGCKGTDSMKITIIPTPTVDFSADKLISCSPMVVNFTSNSTGTLSNCEWKLSNGQTFTSCGGFSDTLYAVDCYDVTLTVITPEGCTNLLTKTDYICVVPDPEALFYTNPHQVNTQQPTAGMVNTSTGATSYQWDFGDNSATSSEFEPSHTFPAQETKIYTITLTATSAEGCVDSTTQDILMEEGLIYYVPNTFTPDDDHFNPTFKPVFTSGFDPQNYHLQIYDRWGELLFESYNASVGWDGTYGGKICQDGTYVWKIDFKLKYTDEHRALHGNVNLLR